jgi:hypothetical protein
MRLKAVLFSLLATGLAISCSLLIDTEELSTSYSPRTIEESEASAEGIAWINQQLRQNTRTGELQAGDWQEMRKSVEEYRRVQSAERATDYTWVEMGPDNIGGRTRALLAVTDDLIYAGAVSGGLWRSDDGANTWSKVEAFPSCMVGSIARTLNGTLYVGTGSKFDGGQGTGGSGFLGAGLWRSDDDGASWSIVAGTEPTPLNQSSNWNAIDALEADYAQDDKVWIGADIGFGYYEGDSDNLQMNTNGDLPAQDVLDMDMSSDGEVFLVGMGQSRVYLSTDGGDSFTQQSGNEDTDLPQGNGRCRVRVSDTDSDHAFVLYSTGGGSMGGVWYSSDGGEDWGNVWPANVDEFDPMGQNTQGIYDLALGIHPGDPTKAFVGGVTFWSVGAQEQPEQIAIAASFGGCDICVHADVHEVTFSPNGDMYIGCDGGVYKSEDGGTTFYAANRGYNVTQFYGIAHGTQGFESSFLGDGGSNEAPAIGGTQDNGTILLFGSDVFATDQEGFDVFGGDGFDCDFSQVTAGDVGVAFVTSQNGVLSRFDYNGGGGMFYDNELLDLIGNDPDGEIGTFYTCVRLYENTEDEDSQQFINLVNPYDSTIFDIDPDDDEFITFPLQTLNLNIPFEYTLEENDTLYYWDSIVRPELFLSEELGEDPLYWWLDPQVLLEVIEECETDSLPEDTVTVIDQIIPIDTCVYFDIPLDTTICWTYDYDTTYTETVVWEYFEDCTDIYHYAGDVNYDVHGQIRVQDQYTSLFAFGLAGSEGVWITREALNLNTTPDWWRVVDQAPGSGVKAIEFTKDGRHMFYSSWGGALYRLDNLHELWYVTEDPTDEDDLDNLEHSILIPQAGSAITGIAVDANDPNHVVITVGGYGTVNGGKVQESFNALDETPTWSNIWFANSDPMGRMPCYDVVIDFTDDSGATILVGTEFGIYATDDGGGTWVETNDPTDTDQSTGIDACPVFALRQQQVGLERWRHPSNSGAIYAGTHGRGIFRSDTNVFTSVEDFEEPEATADEFLLVYPNPVSETAYIDVEMPTHGDITLQVFNIRGALVATQNFQNKATGKHTVQLDARGLANGQYFVHVAAGGFEGVGKFVVIE